MNPTGICYQAYIPMRKEPDEASEMVNQVLYGESFFILEENKPKNFSFIRLHHDKYEGWINSKCIHFLAEKEYEELKKLPAVVSHEMVNLLRHEDHENDVLIGCGSILRLSAMGKTKIGQTEFSIPVIPVNDPASTRQNLVNYGLKLVSAPYLWGGRSSFGFDCSGLCQNLYRQVGIEIPRDAIAQSAVGFSLSFIGEALPGDLAFFDNEEGKIIHTGMIIGDNKIIHASGRVKVDSLDHQGIFSKEQNCYTHMLRLIKKLVE
jgi:gamma-D-glutamyl-L-lysine dipeptidyl-peptidase